VVETILLLFTSAPPERLVAGRSAAWSAALKVSIRIFAEKSSDFVQYAEPSLTIRTQKLFNFPEISTFWLRIFCFCRIMKLIDTVKKLPKPLAYRLTI
jgi:hypothetical protein